MKRGNTSKSGILNVSGVSVFGFWLVALTVATISIPARTTRTSLPSRIHMLTPAQTATLTATPTPIVREDFYVTNGPVNAVIVSGNTVYIGGAFSQVGPPTGSGVPIDSGSGLPEAGYSKIVGTISAVAPDGSGGWYIGGSFTTVGGMKRSNVAHILADNTVADWNPNADGPVDALAVSGPVVYAGGEFANIGGQPRSQIAALDGTTGLATAWNPNANDFVYSLLVNGSTVYAGGNFTNVGGQSRNRVAALNATTGLATTWNPNANATVYALAIDPTTPTLYVGGDFSNIGGQSRNRVAALDATSGQASMLWNPNASNTVLALAVNGGTVYAGGSFTNIGGQQRNHIAAIDATTGLANLLWNPNTNGDVFALQVTGTGTATVYAGGRFTNIGGQIRNYLAALDATGVATSWNPSANNSVNALAVTGSTIYAGGSFTSLGGQHRNNLAALDATTGIVTPWDPSANSTVFALAADSSTIYAGGYFTTVGGQGRRKIAALDPISGAATAWDASSNDVGGFVFSLALNGSTLYAGGSFIDIGGQLRNNIAALDTGSALATSWNPNADGWVIALALNGSTLYAGGSFTTIGGQPRSRIAALDSTTGLATSWNPNSNSEISALAVRGSTVYAGGVFSSIGGQARNNLAALDATSGLAESFSADANYRVWALALSGSTLYAGGSFTTIAGQQRNRLAAVDAIGGNLVDWNPDADARFPFPQVSALAISGNLVYLGGNFTSVGNLPNSYFAAVTAVAARPTPTPTPTVTPSATPTPTPTPTSTPTPGPQCAAPYLQVAGQGVGVEQTGEFNIQSISFGEPFTSCAGRSLTVVIKVNTLDPGNTGRVTPPANTQWQAQFYVPHNFFTPDPGLDQIVFVSWDTETVPTGQFNYGFFDENVTTIGPFQTGARYTAQCSALSSTCPATGTVSPDGTITIKLDMTSPLTFKDVKGNLRFTMSALTPGWQLSQIVGNTWICACAGGNGTPVNVSLTQAFQNYTIQGNASCSNPPVAALTGSPNSGSSPLTVDFDASGSNVPTGGCGTINSYIFDFGDGTKVTQSSPSLSHSYSNPGSYTATVTVRSTFGVNSFPSSSVNVTVSSPPLQLVSAVSRKTHGAAGVFDVSLPFSFNLPVPPPGIECRVGGGMGGDHTLVFTFSNMPVSGSATVVSGVGSVSGSPTFRAHTMTVNLSGVANAQVIGLTLNVTDNFGQSFTDPENIPISMGVLLGDVNGNGLVDGNDVSAVQSHTRQSLDSTNFRFDVNTSGLIDGNDVSITQGQTRTTLP